MSCDVGKAAEELENELRRSWSVYDVGEATEGFRMSCDVGKAEEELENELRRRWSVYDVGEATEGF